jgi:hypothetical protein
VWSRNGQLLAKIDRHTDCVKCVDVLNADNDGQLPDDDCSLFIYSRYAIDNGQSRSDNNHLEIEGLFDDSEIDQ